MASKQILREVFLAKRMQLSEPEFEDRNNRLRANLLANVNLDQVKYIHIFLSIKSKKEVDTKRIMDDIKVDYPSIQFVIPKTQPNGILQHYILNENCELKENKWGITEPIAGDQIDPASIDIVLVPLLIFDKIGHRIGYGKGYYDRFLIQAVNAKKIGLSLLPSIDKIDFVDDTDVKLDSCITPDMVYNFR
jgi:5-formyltetrahydrofolate cyclo-ligase